MASKASLEALRAADAREAFLRFDEGGKGFLTKRDLKLALTALFGVRPSKFEMLRLMKRYAQRFISPGVAPGGGGMGRAGAGSPADVAAAAATAAAAAAPSNGEAVSAVDLPAFLELALERQRFQDPADEVRQMFLAFDVSCNGYLTVDDVQRCFREAAPTVPAHVVTEVFSVADGDGDGRVGFRDFERLMLLAAR